MHFLTQCHKISRLLSSLAVGRRYLWPARVPHINAKGNSVRDSSKRLRSVNVELRDKVMHLGLGADGHTASLVPGDPILDVTDRDVAITGVYQGLRRMSLTYPILNRARRVLWLVTGADKTAMLPRLLAADASIPAGRVHQERALLIADRAAAGPA